MGAPTIRWITDERDFAALATSWDALAEGDPLPFLSHGWFSAWWRAFGARASLAVCTAWQDDGLVAAFPLFRYGRRLEAMANVHSPGFRPLAEGPAALRVVVEAVFATTWTELRLPALEAADPVVEEIAATARRLRRPAIFEDRHRSPVIELGGTFDDFRAATKPRWKSPLERYGRKMEREHGAVLLPVEAPRDLDRELQQGLELEASGWKGAAGTAILSAPDTEAFYRGVATACHAAGTLRFARLELDGRLAAFEFCLLHDRRLWLLKSGFDESFRKFSPGLVLQLAVIRRCYELGLETFELLGDESEVKSKFATTSRPHGELRVFARRPVPAVRFAYRRAGRPLVRRLYRRALGRPLP